jgi:putative oxygen-independent coproporphyrinogen III oxidase
VKRRIPILPAGGIVAKAWGLSAPPPLSVYVHLPWCLRKCPYCDFNSHEWAGQGGPGAEVEDAYIDALQADLEVSLPKVWGRVVQTVFIGGGTPSLFSAQAIDRLLTMLRARLRLAADAEITMEANPGTFEAERFRGYAAAGVNRLSIGVQSFDDARLRALGRVHDAAQAHAAVELAAAVYPTFNLDLMYALPGQSLPGLDADLRAALSHAPPHLSCYHLTLEPNTLFARFPPELPDEDLAAHMQDRMEATLSSAGLVRYEVSAHARPGHRARHNLNYWRFGDYLGIGAGAHAKLSYHDRIVREVRFRHPRRYQEAALAGDAIEEYRTLSDAELSFEFMLNALRLTQGVPASLFEAHTGLPRAAMMSQWHQAVARGLMDPDPMVLRPTPLGQRFLNDLQALFLGDD